MYRHDRPTLRVLPLNRDTGIEIEDQYFVDAGLIEVEEGVDKTVVMKLTGHKTLAMFHRYNTVNQEDAVDAMTKLGSFLAEQKLEKSSDDVQTSSEPKK